MIIINYPKSIYEASERIFCSGGDASTVSMVCEFWLHDSSAFDNFDYSLLCNV